MVNVEVPVQVMWGVIGYILVTTGMGIWWAATTTEQLKSLRELVNKMSTDNGSYAIKSDIAREMGVIEKKVDTMWEKFDKLKEKVDEGIK